MNTQHTNTALAVPAGHTQPLHSRAVVALTGLSYLFVGFGFSFLDRRFGAFGLESFFWLVWAVLGFGAGVFHMGKSASAGQNQWVVLGVLGALLGLLGIATYPPPRWIAFMLLIVIGARAAVLKTRRDFYFTLTVIFVESFMVGTNSRADWTLWFYLGPAWVFGGLALAWDHAAGAPLSRWTKMCMTLGFIAASFLLAIMLFFFAPRPPILGFGFLPPGTDTPGMFRQPGSGAQQGKAASGNSVQGGAGVAQQSAWSRQWEAMLQGMRKAVADKTIPLWQRNIMETVLDWVQTLYELLGGATSPQEPSELQEPREPEEPFSSQMNWLLVLALLLCGYLLWHHRHRLGLHVVLGGAWLLAQGYPVQSMRLSAQAMRWCLHMHGHKRQPGQSVREHWMGAADIAPLARTWLLYALESYCAMRFGTVAATPQQALNMRKAVMGACDIMQGVAPELAR